MSDDTRIMLLIDNAGEIVNEAAREILHYTPQLFCRSETGPLKPEAIASSVLLRVNERSFLVTAAHVLKYFHPVNIGIMIGSDFYILNGEVKYTDISVSSINNKVDLAVWRLHEDVADDLSKQYKFLDVTQIGDRHIVDTRPCYLVVGFPVSRTKRNPEKQIIKPDPFVYLTKIAEQKYYDKLTFDNQQSILVNYQKSKVKMMSAEKKQILRGPEPVGISGCGLWHLPSFFVEKGAKVPLILTAIMLEHHNRFNILSATKISLVTDIIRMHFK